MTVSRFVRVVKAIRHFSLLVCLGLPFLCAVALADSTSVPPETDQAAAIRHQIVAKRRDGVAVICHRGSSEFAFENTLEAYRTTFELGADGNEIDIRRTKDGVLVVFHDDMLDRHLRAFGDVSDYTWDELRRFSFRQPGPFGDQTRIPTLLEVFELHRRYGGLIHLDIKRDGLDQPIADLLTRMDMWDHVAHCNQETGGVILTDPRLKIRQYKAGLYGDHGEVFPQAIQAALDRPGDDFIVNDPRGVVMHLGRMPGRISKDPVSPQKRLPQALPEITESELIAILNDAADWDHVAESPEAIALSSDRIRRRAIAADQMALLPTISPGGLNALERRVRQRSLHHDWMYHGLDGALALQTLMHAKAPRAVELAREALWRDDPALDPVVNPRWKNPRSWTDFRIKMLIFPALRSLPGTEAEKLCRDYLALTEEAATQICPPSFEEAAQALLTISPTTETAIELMKHPLQVVRGRAILDCLAHSNESWAVEALNTQAPHALRYRVEP